MAAQQATLFDRQRYRGMRPQQYPITPPIAEQTVMQTLPAYHAYLRSGGFSRYTPDDFTSDMRKLGLYLKDKPLGTITTTDLQQWVGELQKVMQPKTVSRKLAALTNYFQWLLHTAVLTKNPAATLRYRRVTSPLPDILFEGECDRLLATASAEPRSYLLVLLLLETGLKRAELLSAQLTHFDFSNQYVPELWVKHRDKQVSKDRKLKLPREVAPVFQDYIQRYGVTDVLFPYSSRFLDLILADTAKRAGIRKKVTAGILRDTFAVRCLKRGEMIDQVLLKLGLSEATGEDAKVKYLKLASSGL